MLQKAEIEGYFRELNDSLGSLGVTGEICLYGGAVMCLAYESRPSTKDVDAIFRPPEVFRKAAVDLARVHGLRDDWLNDAVKGFVVTHPSRILFDLSHLKVYVPEPDYLLAMKALAARADTTDRDDVLFLIRKLELKSAAEAFAIIEKYYPRRQIKPVTQFFIEELFEK